MTTVEELRRQLEELRRGHEEEVKQSTAEFDDINRELTEIQELTERLEREERGLEHQLGLRRHSAAQETTSGALSLFSNIMLGLVDPDDAKCKRR